MPSPLELWITALQSPKGIRIETNDRHLLKNQLYRARKDAGNPLLDTLCLILPINDAEIWIVKRTHEKRR